MGLLTFLTNKAAQIGNTWYKKKSTSGTTVNLQSSNNRSTIDKILNPMPQATGFVVPISIGSTSNMGNTIKSGASSAGKIIKSGFNYLKEFTTKKTINPAAGVSGAGNILKTLGKSTLAGVTVGTIFQGGRLIAKSGISGEIPSASSVIKGLSKGAIVGGGLGLSPLGGGIGALQGGGIATAAQAKKQIYNLFGLGQSRIEDATKVFKGVTDTLPTGNFSPPNITYNFPNFPSGTMTDFQMPQSPTNIILTQPELPSASFPTNTSFSLGGGLGGGSEILPLLLLLAGGAGFAGYKLGKRKKKKKYKKKRKH